ncbi:MAG TPA: AAA family ATPase [Sphaerochaeta sp.]|nr:AAA family ATPase [Sphaerochaeta sp.]
MLISVSIKNFKSIRDEVELSMVPHNYIKDKREHIIESSSNKSVQALPLAVLYGKNGSGKTKFVEALDFMRRKITRGGAIKTTPFRLGDANQEKQPSEFTILFKYNDVVYHYGFTIQNEIIQTEWLSAYYTIRPSLLFNRWMEDGNPKISFGNRLIQSTKGGNRYLSFIFQGIKNTGHDLFVREGCIRGVSLLEPVFDWFLKHFVIITPQSYFVSLEEQLHTTDDYLAKMNARIQEMDLDADSLITVEKELNLEQLLKDMDSDEKEKIKTDLENLEEGKNITYPIIGRPSPQISIIKTVNGLRRLVLEASYAREDKETIKLSLHEVSSGLQRMIHLLPALDMVELRDTVFIIDELDRSLHTLLTQYFIKTFTQQAVESSNCSQLIFTTHDTNLLDSELFRSDEIWFTEKDENRSTQLYSLSEFKLTTGLNYERGYLAGRFGAIPLFHGQKMRIQ